MLNKTWAADGQVVLDTLEQLFALPKITSRLAIVDSIQTHWFQIF